jgi:hypothetical protein
MRGESSHVGSWLLCWLLVSIRSVGARACCVVDTSREAARALAPAVPRCRSVAPGVGFLAPACGVPRAPHAAMEPRRSVAMSAWWTGVRRNTATPRASRACMI